MTVGSAEGEDDGGSGGGDGSIGDSGNRRGESDGIVECALCSFYGLHLMCVKAWSGSSSQHPPAAPPVRIEKTQWNRECSCSFMLYFFPIYERNENTIFVVCLYAHVCVSTRA